MKIAYISDVHLESFRYDMPDLVKVDADVLVLAGDIINGYAPESFIAFFVDACHKYKKVFYVLGNHEHYGSDINKTKNKLQALFDAHYLVNISILEKQSEIFEDVIFYGATFWSNPKYPFMVERALNDYELINDGDRHLRIARTISEYDKASQALMNLTINMNYEQSLVVISHNAPTSLSIPDRYKGYSLNEAFANNQGDMIADTPEIVLWIHGHTHNPSNYMVGDTRVVANPIGYFGQEHFLTVFKPEVVEI